MALKAIGGYGDQAVLLLGLDNLGALWWAASNSQNVWGTSWTRIPAPRPYQYFDAVSNVNFGIFVIGSRNGVADTQAFDGTNWLPNPGWSSVAPKNNQFSYPDYVPIPLPVPFPPPFADVAVDNNAGVREDDSAPVVCGLTSDPSVNVATNTTGVMGGGEPFSLYVDANSGDWEWSVMPSTLVGIYSGSVNEPPYPTAPDLNHQSPGYVFYNGAFSKIWLQIPLMLMLGSDGNIYLNDADDGEVANWSFGGALPNPLGLIYTKALWVGGHPFVSATDTTPSTVQIILLGQETEASPAFPYLISMPFDLLYQGTANWVWQWVGQLPGPAPAIAAVDFDIQQGFPDIQVGLLGTDGNIYIKFQDVNGRWAYYDGLAGKGLP